MRNYIYECIFSNNKKIITKNLNDIVKYYNNNFDKTLNLNIIYLNNHYNNKIDNIEELKRHNLEEYFKQELIKYYGNNYNDKSNRQINRYINNIYNRFRLNDIINNNGLNTYSN